MIAGEPGCLWRVSADEYHANYSVVSKGMLETFRDDPDTFRAVYVDRSAARPGPSDDMRLGTALHCLVLEPLEFGKRSRILPATASDGAEWNWRLKAHREQRDAWQAGGNYLWPADLAVVERMRDALLANKFIRAFLDSPGPVEQAIRWIDPATGLPCKSLRDKVVAYPDEQRTVIVDIKTTDDVSPRGFLRTAEKFGYHRTAAWYGWGEEALTGHAVNYLFAAVSRTTYKTAAYELDQDAIELGERQCRRALDRLAECYRSNDWVARWERQVTRLSFAGGAFQAEDWECF